MSSEQVPDTLQELPQVSNHETPDDRRRGTFRRSLLYLAAGALAVGVVVYVLIEYVGTEVLMEYANEYWPIILAPVLGWLLGFWAVHNLYHPTASFYGCLDPETHQFVIVRIPDEMIKYFDQPGNSVQYHTPLGNRYYPVMDMDLQTGRLEYAWPFDADPQLLFSREESYVKWYKWILGVAKENIQLRDNPLLLAILLTRSHLGKSLDNIARMLNMDVPDLSTKDYSMSDLMDDVRGKEEDEDGPEERSPRLHQRHGARRHNRRRLG